MAPQDSEEPNKLPLRFVSLGPPLHNQKEIDFRFSILAIETRAVEMVGLNPWRRLDIHARWVPGEREARRGRSALAVNPDLAGRASLKGAGPSPSVPCEKNRGLGGCFSKVFVLQRAITKTQIESSGSRQWTLIYISWISRYNYLHEIPETWNGLCPISSKARAAWGFPNRCKPPFPSAADKITLAFDRVKPA